jgi:15-cis-phytoene synthase
MSDSTLATPADHAACAMLLRGGSRTFQAASFALPAEVRRDATALYAFCRQADDAVDLGEDGASELARLHERLDLIYARRPLPVAADRAFADVVGLPAERVQRGRVAPHLGRQRKRGRLECP